MCGDWVYKGWRCLDRRDLKGVQWFDGKRRVDDCRFWWGHQGEVQRTAVSCRVRQLYVHPSKIATFVEDHSGTAPVCWEDQDVGIGPLGAESLVLKRG